MLSAIGSVERFLCKNVGAGESRRIEMFAGTLRDKEQSKLLHLHSAPSSELLELERCLLCNPDNAFMSIYENTPRSTRLAR